MAKTYTATAAPALINLLDAPTRLFFHPRFPDDARARVFQMKPSLYLNVLCKAIFIPAPLPREITLTSNLPGYEAIKRARAFIKRINKTANACACLIREFRKHKRAAGAVKEREWNPPAEHGELKKLTSDEFISSPAVKEVSSSAEGKLALL